MIDSKVWERGAQQNMIALLRYALEDTGVVVSGPQIEDHEAAVIAWYNGETSTEYLCDRFGWEYPTREELLRERAELAQRIDEMDLILDRRSA